MNPSGRKIRWAPCPICGGSGGGTLALSWGRWGGFYFHRRPISTRLCLGWLAITYMARDLDCVLQLALRTPGEAT